MSDENDHPPRESNLNPALTRRTEPTHHTDHRTPPPAESASVQREEGQAWPWIWLVVTVVCVLIAIYLIFF